MNTEITFIDLLRDERSPRTCKIDLGETVNHLHRRDRKNVQLFSCLFFLPLHILACYMNGPIQMTLRELLWFQIGSHSSIINTAHNWSHATLLK